MKAKSSFSLKDQLFNPKKVEYLASLIRSSFPEFSPNKFQTEVVKAFPDLELKERIAHITKCLNKYLPENYKNSLSIILDALPPELDPTKTDNDFGDFIFAPFSLYVATYGCTQKNLKISLSALKEITKRFTAEYAIRFFINTFPEETFKFLLECSNDSNYHVRRWASEGTRPTLPWAQKIVTDYKKPLPILDSLYRDNTRFVTRSVANHLNDISKIDAELVVKTLRRWNKENKQSKSEMAFITKHALRTLVKRGNKEALALLGYNPKPKITISNFITNTPKVIIGNDFIFSVDILSYSCQKIMIDYIISFATENKKHPQKVFKLKTLALKKDENITLTKKHPMRLMTTRKLSLGEHIVTLQVNGVKHGSVRFHLVK